MSEYYSDFPTLNVAETKRWHRCVVRDGDCLIWTGRTTNGCPVFYYRGSYHQAAKLALDITSKSRSLYTKSTCGKRDCVNPDHLKLVNAKTQPLPLQD